MLWLTLTKCGYPERFAQQALGHNSKAVHHAYARNAEVTVPSLDDWEENWRKDPRADQAQKLVAVDFQVPPASTTEESAAGSCAAAVG